jgi:hypothetical protein
MARTRPILLPLVLALYGLAILGTLALTFAPSTPWARTASSGGTTSSATSPTRPSGVAPGTTSTPEASFGGAAIGDRP